MLGAAYADDELHQPEKTEVRALMAELAGEMRIEVEACMVFRSSRMALRPGNFDPSCSRCE
ncbi:MAG: hypothetical protein H0T42_14365 [Deltaproteobacteria bacterium]|nr:hypothetical protein [Deltaproteobacteria bacterium]